MEKYDLIVIGGGAAGLNMTIPAARIGLKTLLIEKNKENLGGDCLNTGCVPSKKLLDIAKTVHEAKKAENVGLNISGAVDFKKVRKQIKKVIKKIGEKEDDLLDHENIDLLFDTARFESKRVLRVGKKYYTAKKIILAIGSNPRKLNIKGSEDVKQLTHHEIFDLENLPKNLVVVGGGPIGVELSQAFNRLGSKVYLVHNKDEILDKEEPDMAKLLRTTLEEEGVTILRNAHTKEFTKKNTLRIEKKGKIVDITFDKILVSIGRVHNYKSMQLHKAGITVKENGKLKVNKYLQTTNKDVYACGDATGNYYFTHASEYEAGIILNNLFNPFKKKATYQNFSWVTYTNPQLATFGKTKAQLDQEKKPYKTITNEFKDVNKIDIQGYKNVKQKLYLKKGKIVGGTILAPQAGEIIQELILQMQYKKKFQTLLNKTYPYPTLTRVNRVSMLEDLDKTTPKIYKTILRQLYKWI